MLPPCIDSSLSMFSAPVGNPAADDTITNDVLCHSVCWVVARRKVEPKPSHYSLSPTPAENHIKTSSDIELINFIKADLTENSENLLDMKKRNSIYKVILFEIEARTEHLTSNYKKHREELVEENIQNAVFVKVHKNQPEK